MSKRIQSVFEVCQVEEYVQGTIKRPDPRIDARVTKIWKNNDRFAKHIILTNLTQDQLNHIERGGTAAEVWNAIVGLHQATGVRTSMTYLRALFTMRARDDENMPDFINKMKAYIEQINTIGGFEMNDKAHIAALAQSLPTSWDGFLDNVYRVDPITNKPLLSIVQFERQIKNEYCRRIGKNEDEALHGIHQTQYAVIKKESDCQATPRSPAE